VTKPELGIVGGGQLARMMQESASALGVRVRLLAEGADVSAAQVVPDHVVADYRSLDDLRRVVGEAPVITFDHEHVPPEHLRTLAAEGVVARPGPDALLYAQDKAEMRERLTGLGIPAPRHAVVATREDVQAFADALGGFPIVLKVTRGGYDGKGVWVVREAADADEAFAALDAAAPGTRLLAEELVDFRRELSVLAARRPSGEVVTWPVVESRQEEGVCREVVAPAPDLAADLDAQARAIGEQVATELGVTGVLAVEMFETADGRLLVNELAMRPHNTGHWSMDGAVTSQFENHVRAVLDLPLGSTRPRQAWTVMVNILGGAVTDLEGQRAAVMAQDPDLKVHLYGKQVKPGRKVGHVTAYGDDLADVLERARRGGRLLENGVIDE
jgi:5-(carboxyamino)imidazole ribonucleotide synthase